MNHFYPILLMLICHFENNNILSKFSTVLPFSCSFLKYLNILFLIYNYVIETISRLEQFSIIVFPFSMLLS